VKRYSYSERDYAFGQLMLTLRTTIGLTQAGLADRLGVSRRAVAEWEAGSSYPKAERLRQLIELGVQLQVFPAGREAEEIRALWRTAHQKVLLDEAWLHDLVAPPVPLQLFPQADPDNLDVERELIVVELIPMQSQVPVNLIEVEDRVTQLLYSSKLTLDEKLFQKMNDYVDLIQQIDQALPPGSTIRQLPGYLELKRHRKIDSFLVITMTTPELHSGASDFSRAAIERRIASGYHDALTQLEEFDRRSS